MMTRCAALALLLCVPTLEAAEPCVAMNLTPVPATIVWKMLIDVRDAKPAGDLIVVETRSRILGVSSMTGATSWDAPLAHSEDTFRTDPMVVLQDRVAVALGQEILFVSTRDGKTLARAVMPRWVRMLAGPPLIAVVNNDPRLGSTLYALDGDGRIHARMITRNVEEMWIADGRVIARTVRNIAAEAPEYNVVAAFSASDLTPLWKFRSNGADLQQIAGRWYIGATPWSPMRLLDLETGRLDAALPAKEPSEITWGGATWEVEVVASAEGKRREFPVCERLRVNDPASGQARWISDLPFAITFTTLIDDRLYVFGSSSDTQHFLAALDWRSGRLLHLWSGIPMFLDRLFKRGDLLIGAGISDGVFAMNADQ